MYVFEQKAYTIVRKHLTHKGGCLNYTRLCDALREDTTPITAWHNIL